MLLKNKGFPYCTTHAADLLKELSHCFWGRPVG